MSIADQLLDWMEGFQEWKLAEHDFYTQYECSFSNRHPPDVLMSPVLECWEATRVRISAALDVELISRVDICAHKLAPPHQIRIHNDFVPGCETHRAILQLNRGWSMEMGGLLVLFSNDDPASASCAYLPVHNSIFAFAISARSFHGVTQVQRGERFSLVFNYRTV